MVGATDEMGEVEVVGDSGAAWLKPGADVAAATAGVWVSILIVLPASLTQTMTSGAVTVTESVTMSVTGPSLA